MIKVGYLHNRQITPNNFVDKGRGKFQCEHFTKFFPGLHEIFACRGLTSHLLSFVSMWYNQFSFDKKIN